MYLSFPFALFIAPVTIYTSTNIVKPIFVRQMAYSRKFFLNHDG